MLLDWKFFILLLLFFIFFLGKKLSICIIELPDRCGTRPHYIYKYSF